MVLERLLLTWKHWQRGPQPPQQDLCLGTPGFWSDPSWQSLLGAVLVVLVGKCCRVPLSITPQALGTWWYR